MIATNVSSLNPGGIEISQSNVWCPLIWKALHYNGYNVNPECLKVELIDSNNEILCLNQNTKYDLFNNFAIDLANLPGWPEYAANILLNDNYNYNSNDNNFESDIVRNKTFIYTNMINGNIKKYKNDHKKYKKNANR